MLIKRKVGRGIVGLMNLLVTDNPDHLSRLSCAIMFAFPTNFLDLSPSPNNRHVGNQKYYQKPSSNG